MEIITSHIGTDFDSLAAMVACGKLHSSARIVLSGSQRPAVRQFVSLHKDTLRLYRANQLEIDRVSVLYIVDAPGCGRLGDLAWLCDKAEKVITYDHHPPFNHAPGIQDPVGAATTILTEQLKKGGQTISPFEATLFLLGIYEDTGCLTNAGTTVRDVLAAAWLLGKGANLTEVSKYINIPLNTQQRDLFEMLLGEAQTQYINQRSVLITEASLDQFVGGLGRLTHRLAELEACDLAVSIVRMEDRVHLVARSLRSELNLLELLEPMGVSGHVQAVTLTVKGANTAELRQELVKLLRERMLSGQTAMDLMTTPVKTIDDSTTIAEANRLLLRYGHTGMPVVNQHQVLVGIVSRRDVDKAIRHDLGHAPVRGYMTKNVVSVNTDSTLDEITRIIIQNDIGRVPVLEKGRLVGIITRTDVLRQIHGDNAPRWHKPLYNQSDYRIAKRMDNLTELINNRLPKRIQGLLLLLGQKAEKEGFKAYAVGGFVRDLILGVPNYDLDIAVEDNAINFARMLPPLLGGKLYVHEEFGTATLTLPDGFQIDFATARMEFYQFPAASPEVEQTTIKHDLYRRDFTINTLAFSLNSGGSFGKFLDFFGGYDDLQAGLIRVLYNLSFVEDPTRILRAIRFGCRYGFKLEDQTRSFMETALQDKMLTKASDARLGHEFRHLFNEPNVPALLSMAREMGVLGAVLPGLEWNENLNQQILAAARTIQWNKEQNLVNADSWLVYPVLLLMATGTAGAGFLKRLGLTLKEQREAEAVVASLENVSQRLTRPDLSASEIYELLHQLPVIGLLALMAANPGQAMLRSRVLLYLEQLADVELSIDGHDLIKLGFEPGPEMGRALKALRRARLDGEIASRDEELALADSLLNGKKGE